MAGNSGSGTTPTNKDPASAPSNLTSGGGGQSEQNRLAGMVSQAAPSLPSPQTAPAAPAPTGFDPSMAGQYNQMRMDQEALAKPAPAPAAAAKPPAATQPQYTSYTPIPQATGAPQPATPIAPAGSNPFMGSGAFK